MEEQFNRTTIIFWHHCHRPVDSDHAVAEVSACDLIVVPEANDGMLAFFDRFVFFGDELGIER